MDGVGALTYVLLFLAFVGGGYGCGTWLGKLHATMIGGDRAYEGDIGGMWGGGVGLGLFIGVVLGKVIT